MPFFIIRFFLLRFTFSLISQNHKENVNIRTLYMGRYLYSSKDNRVYYVVMCCMHINIEVELEQRKGKQKKTKFFWSVGWLMGK